jgi:hypothetical protein
MKATEIEIAVAEHIGIRQHLIVPNVSWGLGLAHECDILYITKSGYAHEVEIKVSRSDLLRDQKKRKYGDYFRECHYHECLVRSLTFAIPAEMGSSIPDIPEYAGVLLVEPHPRKKRLVCREVRKAKPYKDARKLTDEERFNLARLGAMRIWGLKRKLLAAEREAQL